MPCPEARKVAALRMRPQGPEELADALFETIEAKVGSPLSQDKVRRFLEALSAISNAYADVVFMARKANPDDTLIAKRALRLALVRALEKTAR